MKAYLFASLLLFSFPLAAQETSEEKVPEEKEKKNLFTVDAQLLTRGEVRKGGMPSKDSRTPDENLAAFVLEHTSLSVGYERGGLSAKITAYHEGVWGMGGDGDFNIYEAWANLKAKNGLFACVGRQELCYDDERILGNNNMAIIDAVSHDALKLGYEGHGHKVHAAVAYNQNPENMYGGSYYTNGAKIYKTMQTVWYHYDIPKVPIGASLLFMNIGLQIGTEKDYHTAYQQLYGAYVTYKPKHFDVEASYYRQSGKTTLPKEQRQGELPLKAWMASIKATYHINDDYSVYAGYDYLSGDKEFVVPGQGQLGMVQHKEINSFTSPFGSSHKFYGAMDFFYVSSYFGTFSPGLQDLYAGGNLKPLKGMDINASYHFMGITSDVPNLKKPLGHEIALAIKYTFWDFVSVSAGYSFMHGTETMERLKRSTDKRQLHWGWLMLNVNPQIFKLKW